MQRPIDRRSMKQPGNTATASSEMRRRAKSVASLSALLLAVCIAPVLAQEPAGKDLMVFYRQNCAGCHGPDGSAVSAEGKKLRGRDFTDSKWLSDTQDDEMVKTILEGKFFGLAMPGFKGTLTGDEVQRMVTDIIRKSKKGQVIAADRAQKAEAAESKAEVLEQNAAAEGSKAIPSPSEIITKTEAQAVDPVGEEPLNDAITCLSRTIYWEARGDGAAGMEAIANVVMNRLGKEGFPNTICDVVMQGREQGACQFSWWCDGHSDDAKEDKSYAIAKEIARKALNRQLTDRTGGALYFHQQKLNPSWAAEYIKTVEVGEHVFYKPHGGSAK